MFGQLSRRESLRDLIVAVEAHSGKAKFLGFGDSVTRSNLAKANQNRDCRIFEEYAFYMMELARNLNDTTIFNLGGMSPVEYRESKMRVSSAENHEKLRGVSPAAGDAVPIEPMRMTYC